MDDAQLEAVVSILAAKIRTSSVNLMAEVSEPDSGHFEMTAMAYAMFSVLVPLCFGTCVEKQDWWDFLRCALNEAIDKAEQNFFGLDR